MAEDGKIMPDESEVAALAGRGGGRSLITAAHNARTMGNYLDGEPSYTRKLIGSHSVKDGCQWSRKCDDCPWVDCVLGVNRYDYDSDEAKEIRKGMTASVRRSAQAIRKRPLSSVQQRRMQMVGLKRAGMPEQAIADRFNVHIRTVRRAMEWVEGLHTKPWGVHR